MNDRVVSLVEMGKYLIHHDSSDLTITVKMRAGNNVRDRAKTLSLSLPCSFLSISKCFQPRGSGEVDR